MNIVNIVKGTQWRWALCRHTEEPVMLLDGDNYSENLLRDDQGLVLIARSEEEIEKLANRLL